MNTPAQEIKSKFDMSSIKYPDRIFAALLWLVNLVRPSKIQNNLSRLSLI